MSGKNIGYEFKTFGKKMSTIAVLTLIAFIASIIGIFLFVGSIINIIMNIIILFFFLQH